MHKHSSRKYKSETSRSRRPTNAQHAQYSKLTTSSHLFSNHSSKPSITTSHKDNHHDKPSSYHIRSISTSQASSSHHSLMSRQSTVYHLSNSIPFDNGSMREFSRATTFEIPVKKPTKKVGKPISTDSGSSSSSSSTGREKSNDLSSMVDQHISQRTRTNRSKASAESKTATSPSQGPIPPKRYKLSSMNTKPSDDRDNNTTTTTTSSSSSRPASSPRHPSKTTDNANTASKKGQFQQKISLPPGMTPERFQSLSPDEMSKVLGIDMARISLMKQGGEHDAFETKFDEDHEADFAPPQPLPVLPSGEDPKYMASRIPGRRSVNMMPAMAPRPATFKGRLTLTQRLPPRFENIQKGLRKTCQAMLEIQGLKHFDLAVTLVSAQGMQNINRETRGENFPTDVLAFPMEDAYAEGIPVEVGNIADLGEIMLCVPYLYAQAAIRHAMLRQVGIDLSDSKRPISDLEKLHKALNSITNIAVNDDGQLKLSFIDDIDNNGYNEEEHKLRALRSTALPPITLSSIQLDNLPPFDHEALKNNLVLSQKTLGQTFSESQQVIQAIKPSTPSNHFIGDDVAISPNNPLAPHLLHDNTHHSNAFQKTIHHETNHTSRNDAVSTQRTQSLANHQSSHNSPIATITTGYPPHNYFKYITRDMVRDEMNIVLLHGFLHLLGYDHHTRQAREKMQKETDRMVKVLVEKGIFTERCGQLATLYVLDDDLNSDSNTNDDTYVNKEEILPLQLFLSDNEAIDVQSQTGDTSDRSPRM